MPRGIGWRAYQRVESRRVRAICNVIPIALTAGVRTPVHAQRGGWAEFMPRRGQQPALIYGTVDRCLSGCRNSRVGYGSARGLAASGQRVGCHEELGGNKRNSKTYRFPFMLNWSQLYLCTNWSRSLFETFLFRSEKTNLTLQLFHFCDKKKEKKKHHLSTFWQKMYSFLWKYSTRSHPFWLFHVKFSKPKHNILCDIVRVKRVQNKHLLASFNMKHVPLQIQHVFPPSLRNTQSNAQMIFYGSKPTQNSSWVTAQNTHGVPNKLACVFQGRQTYGWRYRAAIILQKSVNGRSGVSAVSGYPPFTLLPPLSRQRHRYHWLQRNTFPIAERTLKVSPNLVWSA